MAAQIGMTNVGMVQQGDPVVFQAESAAEAGGKSAAAEVEVAAVVP